MRCASSRRSWPGGIRSCRSIFFQAPGAVGNLSGKEGTTMAQHQSPAHSPGTGTSGDGHGCSYPRSSCFRGYRRRGWPKRAGSTPLQRTHRLPPRVGRVHRGELCFRASSTIRTRSRPSLSSLPTTAPLSTEDITSVAGVVGDLGSLEGVGVLSPLPSPPRRRSSAGVPVDPSSDIADTVTAVREALANDLPSGLTLRHRTRGTIG